MVRHLVYAGAVVSIAAVCGVAAAGPSASAEENTMRVGTFLCDSAAHAVHFANRKGLGDSDEIAKDRVGRSAKAEVCGLYIGLAAIQSESVKLNGGVAYKLTAFRFKKDQKVAWLAETSFAPVHQAWDY